mmetsp:Transcript_13810/g.39690  ORF Transcript_13810/g.39690 Transcript_13810/m.39690 type:complete len:280 (-) Transcript_13810:3943-4782(-)
MISSLPAMPRAWAWMAVAARCCRSISRRWTEPRAKDWTRMAAWTVLAKSRRTDAARIDDWIVVAAPSRPERSWAYLFRPTEALCAVWIAVAASLCSRSNLRAVRPPSISLEWSPEESIPPMTRRESSASWLSSKPNLPNSDVGTAYDDEAGSGMGVVLSRSLVSTVSLHMAATAASRSRWRWTSHRRATLCRRTARVSCLAGETRWRAGTARAGGGGGGGGGGGMGSASTRSFLALDGCLAPPPHRDDPTPPRTDCPHRDDVDVDVDIDDAAAAETRLN